MKNSIKRRLLSLLLALVMVLALAPTALLAPGDTTDPPEASDNDDEGPEEESTIKNLTLNCGDFEDKTPPDYAVTLETDPKLLGTVRIETILEPQDPENRIHITWRSSDRDGKFINVDEGRTNNGHTASITALNPGKATVTVYAEDKDWCTVDVTVSGISLDDGGKLSSGVLTLGENESVTLQPGTDFTLWGNAKNGDLKAEVAGGQSKVECKVNNDKSITLTAIQEGEASVSLSVETEVNGERVTYRERFTVKVEEKVLEVPYTKGVSPSAPLKFSDLIETLNSTCQSATGGKLASVTDLKAAPAQGIIYQGYQSPDDTGSGAGSGLTYTVTGTRGPYLRDLTFVPNASFTGEKAEITFVGTADNGRTFKCKIIVTLTDAKAEDVKLTTRSDVPLKLKADDFARVCQAQTGGPLSYVIFTLPPAAEGTLYRDYKNSIDYAAKVNAAEQFDRKGLDDITFVPAEGFVGTVTIGYAGYSTTGLRFDGEMTIEVTRSLDRNIQYQDYGSGVIAFSAGDFDSYCEAMTGSRMATISFTLPPASQGGLYFNWVNGRGTAVAADNTFTYNQVNYVTFVAVEGFDGVVRIPFAGKDTAGRDFSGTAELHIQAAVAQNGDIYYTCQPSQSVKLVLTDFANLCQSVTGARLYYVSFQSLPVYTQGSLFYNRTSSGAIGTRVSTAAKYFNSAMPYLNNVSFWAAAGFTSVEIPFTLASVNGDTFTGLLVISSGSGAGGGQSGAVTYATGARQPVTFNGSKFDAACRQATNSALNYVRFSLPSSGQGILYYDYKEGKTPRALDTNTALYLSGEVSVDKVTFMPAAGFSGLVTVPFTGLGINGTAFQGVVEITVRPGNAYGSIVRYSTGGAPVHFLSYDLTAASGIGQPTSVRLTGLPSSSQGHVYYQYSSVTKYSWMGNTTVTYSVTGDPSVSNLTFIPRAGYEGVVTIPYTATGADGVSSSGSIEITVTQPAVSLDFDDLGGYSAATNAAVEYLSNVGVVNGTAPRTYSPSAAILRGDFCLMVSRGFQFDVDGTGRTFSDVPYDSYYAQAINEMYALGIVNGVGNGRFQPTANISRQDAAVMVRRALDKAGLTIPDGSNEAALANYSDRNQVDNYARDALGSLVRTGAFPVSGNRLSPKAAITRAEMAVLLHRAMTFFS